MQNDTVEWDKELKDRSKISTGIKIPGYGEISVGEDAKEIEMALVNPKDNPCYFRFTIKASVDNKEVTLFKSKLVEQGKAIEKFPVKNLPKKGDYKMTVVIHTYSDKDAANPLNGANVQTVLHVL